MDQPGRNAPCQCHSCSETPLPSCHPGAAVDVPLEMTSIQKKHHHWIGLSENLQETHGFYH